jgi:hypothetical protein
MEEKKGKNGGMLKVQQLGDPALPGAGRKPNPFRHHIRELAETEQVVVLKGRLLDANGNPTGKLVKVAVSLPGAQGIVIKAMKAAAKNDAQARRWLTETGWGKDVNLANDPDNPLGGGFVLVLPENKR